MLEKFWAYNAKIPQFVPKILNRTYILLREELQDQFYPLLLGFWGGPIVWHGLEVPIFFLSFLAILAAPASPARGLRAGRAGRNFFRPAPKFFREFFLSKLF